MVSMKHEGLLFLFRNRPTLAPELLRDSLHFELPSYSEARVESAELTEVVPTEYRADLVVLLLEGQPVFAIVVEVQLSRDEDKRKSWPMYLISLRARVNCPTALLVVAPSEELARWCARPIELGHPGFVLQPLVLGPGAIPVVLDEQTVRQDPELAVLSAMAHAHEEVGLAITRVLIDTTRDLEDKRFNLYVDMAVSSLSDAARRALEELMKSGTYEYQTDFIRKWVAEGLAQGLEQGLEQGREQGREQGLEQGREKGRQEGIQEGELTALLEVLDARGLKVHAEARRKLRSCTDAAQLKAWLRKAVTVSSVEELFTTKPSRSPRVSKPRSRR